jgi:hypothetical protein
MGFSRGSLVASDSTNSFATEPDEVQPRNTAPTRGLAITQPLPFGPVIPSLHATVEGELDHNGL